jgi:hypothetical protein
VGAIADDRVVVDVELIDQLSSQLTSRPRERANHDREKSGRILIKIFGSLAKLFEQLDDEGERQKNV